MALAAFACACAQPALADFPYAAGDPHDYSSYHLDSSGTPPNDFGDDWKLAASPEQGAPPNITADPRELNGVRGAHLVDNDPALDTAFKLTTGRPDVGIAVLDSGIKWNDAGAMSDLRFKVRLNKGELPLPEHGRPDPGCSGYADAYDANGDGVFNLRDYLCDQRVDTGDPRHEGPPGTMTPQDLLVAFSNGDDADGNGFVDDIAGWDFLDNDNDPFDDVQYGHGTGEARDSNAEANNGGDLGTCPNCMVVPLRVGDSFVADVNNFAQATFYAVDNGIYVVQEALGTLNNSVLARKAVDYAYYHGVTVIASAADEAAQHHNWPSTYAHSIVVNSVVKYPTEKPPGTGTDVPLTPDRLSYLDLNGCTNFSTRVTVAIPSSSCSSNATGNGAGMAGLIYSEALNVGGHASDCHLVSGDPCPISPNEVRQLMASGTLPGQDPAQVKSPDTTGLSDDIDFMSGGTEPSCTPVPAPGCTDPNNGFAVADAQRPYLATELFKSYPARAGFDPFYGYGRVNLVKGLEAMRAGHIPPEAEITSPEWYGHVDPGDPNVNIGAQLDARGAPYTCKVEVAPGSSPSNGGPTGDFSSDGVSSQWCDGTTTHTARFDDVVAQVNISSLKAKFPPGTAFDGPEPRPSAPNLNNRPNQEPYGFTVRVVVSAVDAPHMTGQDRRNLYLTRDSDMLAGYPKQFPSDGASSPALADLDGDNRNELVFGTSDGRVHALRRDGSELPGWPVKTPPLPLHTGGRAFTSGDIDPDTSHSTVLASPAVGDIDHDGVPEVVVADLGGHLSVYNADGSLKWRREANPDWSGKPLHQFENVRRGKRYRTQHGFIASPVLADLDGDKSRLEVIQAGMDRHLYAWTASGDAQPGFPVLVIDRSKITAIDPQTHAPTFDDSKAGGGDDELNQGAIVDTPAVGDITGDGKPEIVVGTNEEYLPNLPGEGGFNSSFTTPTLTTFGESSALGSANSRLYAIRATGDPGGPSMTNGALFLDGFPAHIGVLIAEILPVVGEGITGSPTIAPVSCPIHDAGGPNKIGVIADVGPGFILNSDGQSCQGRDPNGHDNALASDFAVSATKTDAPAIPAFGHPAFGDLGGSGPSFLAPAAGLERALDAAVPEYQGGQDFLAAWDASSGTFAAGWPVPVNDLQFLTGPSVADIDGQAGEEVLGGTASLELEGLKANGTPVAGFPKLTGDWMVANPVAGSFGTRDTDAGAHKVVAAMTRSGILQVFDTQAPACSPGSWPRFHHDNANSGSYDRDAVSPGAPYDVAASSLSVSFRVPGDDLLCGRAKEYEAVSSDQPIRPDFAGATPFDAPAPAAPGNGQTVTFPANAGRYVAIRAVDEQGNVGRAVVIDRRSGDVVGAPGTAGSGGGDSPGNGTPAAGCRDRTRPRTSVRRRDLRAGRRGLRVKGRASDSGCSGSRVRRELVSVALVRGRSCRFLKRGGGLTGGRSCRRPLLLRARGASRWSFRSLRRLPVGRYRLVARAVDAAGNRERPARHNRVAFRVR